MVDRQDGWTPVSTSIAAVTGLIVGGFVGALTTFVHRQWRIPLGDLHPPLGLVVGFGLVAALVVGFRLAFPRIVAAAGAVGVVAVAALLALPGAGGSAVVSGDAIGWTWLIGCVLASALALVWPGRARRPDRAPSAE